LLASPSVLAQIAARLGRLKTAWSTLSYETGQALGNMADDHPLLKSARSGRRCDSPAIARRNPGGDKGVEWTCAVQSDRIRTLKSNTKSIQGRFGALATMRAEYSNLVTADETAQRDAASGRAADSGRSPAPAGGGRSAQPDQSRRQSDGWHADR